MLNHPLLPLSKLPLLLLTLLTLLAATIVHASTPCPPGTFTTSTKCKKCPPGTYQPNANASSCISCPRGTFNIFKGAQGIDLCEPCKPNTFGSKPGATSPSQCQRCPSGTVAIAGSSKCVTCPPGTYVTLPSGLPESYQRGYNFCPPVTTDFRGRRTNNPDCAFPRRTRCRKCPKATFSNTTNSLECTRCPRLTFAVLGSSECKGCGRTGIQCVQGKRERECRGFEVNDGSITECVDCPPGFVGNRQIGGSECLPCPAGLFKDRFMGRCMTCDGEKVIAFGGTACLDAVPNTPCPSNFNRHQSGYCFQCERWERFNAKKQICQECPANKLSEGSVDRKCRPCPPNTQRPKGSQTCFCKPGFVFISQKEGCRACPAGTRAIGGCFPCRGGTVSKASAAECRLCPFNFVPRGLDKTQCERCPRGLVPNPRRGCVSPATNCPVGQTRRLDENGFLVGCVATSCPAGTFLRSESCISCSKTFRYEAASNTCVRCGRGLLSEGGVSTTCEEICPEGYLLNNDLTCSCNDLRHVVNGKCVPCSPGSTGNGCLPCPVGTFSVRNGCSKCSAGTFSDKEGSTKCKPCPSGTFTLWPGSANCVVRGSLA